MLSLGADQPSVSESLAGHETSQPVATRAGARVLKAVADRGGGGEGRAGQRGEVEVVGEPLGPALVGKREQAASEDWCGGSTVR